eukprot:SAG31_NODE_35194_length_325_cov_0.920354_1_plen_31_part_10
MGKHVLSVDAALSVRIGETNEVRNKGPKPAA